MEVCQKTVLRCKRKRVASHPDTLLSEMTAGHTLRRRMCSHLFFSVQWYLQVGCCWPRNALGEPELAYYLSAGHLLDSAFVLQLQPRYLCVPESASVPSWALNRLFTNVHTTTSDRASQSTNGANRPESRIRHPYTHEKHGVHFRKSGNSCGALLGGNESSSAYPLMTLPVRCAVIRPGFASIADTLREEFANKGLRLYENIYID